MDSRTIEDHTHGSLGRIELPAALAQLVEQLTCNEQVIGSSPIRGFPKNAPGVRFRSSSCLRRWIPPAQAIFRTSQTRPYDRPIAPPIRRCRCSPPAHKIFGPRSHPAEPGPRCAVPQAPRSVPRPISEVCFPSPNASMAERQTGSAPGARLGHLARLPTLRWANQGP